MKCLLISMQTHTHKSDKSVPLQYPNLLTGPTSLRVSNAGLWDIAISIHLCRGSYSSLGYATVV